MIKTFEDLIKLLTKRGARKRLAVVNGIDAHTQRAVEMALDEGFVDIIFVGGKEIISRNQAMAHYHNHIEYVDADNHIDAAHKAVELVRDGKADMLMKGRINTDDLLRAVLDKEKGMLALGQRAHTADLDADTGLRPHDNVHRRRRNTIPHTGTTYGAGKIPRQGMAYHGCRQAEGIAHTLLGENRHAPFPIYRGLQNHHPGGKGGCLRTMYRRRPGPDNVAVA